MNLKDYKFPQKNSLNKKVYITFDDGFKSIINATEESINNGFKTIAYTSYDYINQDGFLNEKEIKYLHKIGCLIGSHSRSHQNLKYLDKEELIKELKISKDILSQITGEEIKDFPCLTDKKTTSKN